MDRDLIFSKKDSKDHNKKPEKSFKWLERSNITNLDTPLLYQEHKVCAVWYYISKFYHLKL